MKIFKKDEFWHIKLLSVLSIPMLLINIYENLYKTIHVIINGRVAEIFIDFSVYLRTAAMFINNPASIYNIKIFPGVDGFWYPPISIFIFLPFHFLPAPYNLIIWRIFNILLFFLSIRFLLKIFEEKIRSSY
jgi:hypothetical protein